MFWFSSRIIRHAETIAESPLKLCTLPLRFGHTIVRTRRKRRRRCNGLYGGWYEKAPARERNVGSRPRRSYFPQKTFASKIPIFNVGSEVQLLSQLLCNFSRGLFLFCVSHCNFFTPANLIMHVLWLTYALDRIRIVYFARQ